MTAVPEHGSHGAAIAVIADVHGNSDALRAVLADIDALGIGPILNLGDHFSGPLAAAETAELIAARDMICIRGNHDRWLIDQSPDEMGPSDRVAYDQLAERDLDWLRSLPATLPLGDDIFMCHGTPASDTSYWMERVAPSGEVLFRPLDEIETAADGLEAPVLLCGHTHRPRLVRLRDGRIILNPGSVGLPAYDDDLPVYHVMESGNPAACYAVLSKGAAGWDVSFRAVPYDASRMAALAEAAGRPDWASAVATGWLRAQTQA
ncbi:metallophosphoesterase family protein [Roseobacter sinensis]|uniref:Metallophosphatase family protein n=1 Tax=Roseobacter sinensis TaxID=2931391 RepID=A0ABT3BEJ6_9RHOB|nr:metallophosphoesterase family protein [Roseobacter sp. WL0113]MCV3272002.1 metallophosphatase family protein [Roseobacter sp. WL0113]